MGDPYLISNKADLRYLNANSSDWKKDGCTNNSYPILSWQAFLTQPIASISAQTNVLCIGASTGSASISVTGGTTPFTFDWTGTPTGNGTASISNLVAGTYTCLVQDLNNCSASIDIHISDPSSIIVWGAGSTNTNDDANGRFANPFNTAGSWQIQSVSDNNGVNVPGNALWTRSLTGKSQGVYVGGLPSIGSPSESDGVALFDSDYLDNGGVAGAFSSGTSPSPHVDNLISSSIDLSAFANKLNY